MRWSRAKPYAGGRRGKSTWKGRRTQYRRLRRRTKLVLRRATYVEVGPMTMMQQRRIRYLGLDVHKASIAVAIADEAGAPTSYGSIANDPSAIRTLMTRLGGPEIELRVAYEAGPTGYALHRQLVKMGIECMVVAPSLIPKRSGDKVKTDRRDPLKLARLLRDADLTPFWVPDEAHKALRTLCGAGDLGGFGTASQVMGLVGVVPFESGSGGKQQRGPITKTGNSLLRHVLGEAAHHARHAPRVSGTLKQRQADLPREIVDLAWRAQLRLHARYRHLSLRIGSRKALTAIARELAGFIWAAGHVLQEVPAAA